MNNFNHYSRMADLAGYLKDYLLSADVELANAKTQAQLENPFFTIKEINRMIDSIQLNYLNIDKLENWFNSFPVDFKDSNKVIGIIGAGNIPYVSLHDIWCCLAAGFKIVFKPASKDRTLLINLIEKINAFLSEDDKRIQIVEKLNQFDAVITTGGHQATQVFKSYFEKYPSLIRGHRNSIAILSGEETEADLLALGNDIFSYYGLGCRNVHHLYVPIGFEFARLLDVFDANFSYVKECVKYCNNYDYYLASQLLGKAHFYQAETILLIESTKLNPPIACLYFSYYLDIDHLKSMLVSKNDQLQCICGDSKWISLPLTPFGTSQFPELTSYQDNLNTIAFLASL
ncbi:MAG: hypothetical protein JNL65_03870 [Saprospiraceae bacterium]|nr:hypothetical protein [Saprospiraceae bacterium]